MIADDYLRKGEARARTCAQWIIKSHFGAQMAPTMNPLHPLIHQSTCGEQLALRWGCKVGPRVAGLRVGSESSLSYQLHCSTDCRYSSADLFGWNRFAWTAESY